MMASTGNAPKIDLTTSLTGYLPQVHGGVGGKNKLDATNPTLSDDVLVVTPQALSGKTRSLDVSLSGVGVTNSAAVWRELVQIKNGTTIEPQTHDTS